MPKRTAGGGENGIAKIRVVQDIKHLATKLEIEPLGDFGVLGYGKIRIQKTWSGDGIAAETARMTSPGNDRESTGTSRNVAKGAGSGKGRIGR